MNVKLNTQKSLPRNFVDHLRSLSVARAEDVALVVVGERDGVPEDKAISYRQLDQRVRALAAVLQQQFQPGERALLLLDNNDHYAVAFFACLYAGLIAVPVFPPESPREQHFERLMGIAEDSGARCVLTSSDVVALVGSAISELFGIDPIVVDTIDPVNASHWVPQSPVEDAVAFLQYTSGSTSAPKGVMVTHGNLMANERAMEKALSVCEEDVFVCWLPLFHDMGLIGGLLQPFYCGVKVVLMTPRFFLERPVRWLETISRHKGTVSGGPDFSYRLCTDRIKERQLAGLDLSCWRIAFSGAEPVRYDTVNGFINRFSKVAFQARSVNPGYGLAEATLMVTSGERGAGMVATAFQEEGLQLCDVVPDPEGKALVACGRVVAKHQVSIRDPQERTPCCSGAVGEIWVSGPSIAKGYWNKPRETADTFVEQDGVRWLRTGDLGFMHEGQLHIAGRLKDLIIVRGHNLYPQDIEGAVESSVDAVRRGRVAAFAVAGPDGEAIGLAVEVSRSKQKRVPADELAEALSVVVSESCGESLSVAVLLNPGALPKTSSGKLQRRACHQGWQNKTLDAYAVYEYGNCVFGEGQTVAPEVSGLDDMEVELAGIWSAALGERVAKKIDRHTHFFAVGGNSLAATQVAAAIESRWEVAYSVRQMFEWPRLSECAGELRRRLADEKGETRTVTSIPKLSPADRDKPLPLSSAQQRQWFLWRFDPSSTAYHIQGALRLQGRLDRDALATAVDALVQRHESLRTVFSEAADGQVKQHAATQERLSLSFLDLPNADDRQVQQTLQQFNTEAFDLSKGPLARITLIRLSEFEHVLVMVMHHIITDGVSMQLLMDELAAIYAAWVDGRELELAALPIQYTDYAVWQRQWLGSDESERQLRYWCEQLGGDQPVLALPTDHPRRPVTQYRAGQCDFRIPDEVTAKLHVLAEDRDVTLFMLLLASFHVLLHRYTGQYEIRVGVPVANRTRTQTQKLVGFLVNTVVLRQVVDSRMPMTEMLEQVRRSTMDAHENQDLPFERLVEALQPQRSLSHNPLFQVMYNHLHEEYQILQGLPGLSVTQQPCTNDTAQFELTLDTREDANGCVRACLTYAVELFDAGSIERMARHYVTVLEALAEQPDRPVGEIDLLSSEEKARLNQWGVNNTRYPDTEPVHSLIERQVQGQPDAVALIFNGEQRTYGELNSCANQLAHHLIGLGVKPETKVGIAMERSIEMVVGLLGVLKSGGTYVPLDPEYPEERLAYTISDSGIELLLTQTRLKETLPLGDRLPVLELDNLDLSGESTGNPQIGVYGSNLAYVIYTSGSTGKPKGAANCHQALYNRLLWMQEAYHLDTSDAVLQKTPFSFDVSVWEFFWPLIVGARLVVAPPGAHRDPAQLIELIRRCEVTTLHFVPSMLKAFLEGDGVETCTHIKRIICSGEALPIDAQNAVFERLPGATLYNLYGPTEAAIDVTHWTCRADGNRLIPIGQPISDTQTWVLDDELNLVAQGVAGELYLGGTGLARGYLNRRSLTAERFVAAPLGLMGERLYRTGDLVRWNAEGQLEYLGRIDHQVKIRGFRIELGEVEAALLTQPEVREAVIVAKEDPAGIRLVGFVSGRAGHTVDAAPLRERLGQSLPDYMVPSVIVVLEALPLSANGKVDRQALPEPEISSSRDYEVPQGEVETTLARIWAEVLSVERVGRHDNFFELGGHSLNATMLVSRVRFSLGTDLPLRRIFEFPSLQAMATCIQGQLVERASTAEQLQLLPVHRKPSMPLSPAQQRLWLVERMSAPGSQKNSAYTMAASLRLTGSLDLSILQTTLDTIVARHEVLRTIYLEDDDGEPIAVIPEPSGVHLPIMDLTHVLTDERDEVTRGIFAEFAARRINLAIGPMMNSKLLRFDATQHLLLLCIHHIAFDGWSSAVFAREFAAIYESLNRGATPSIPELKIQYADYAVWQRQRLAAASERHKKFWCNYLNGAPAVSTLSPDRLRSTKASDAGDVLRTKIPDDAVRAVKRLARDHETSAFTFLLASFTALLHRWIGADDIVIGTDVAGRNHPDLESLIGFFVNVVPLRSRFTKGMTFVKWLQYTKASSLSAFEHQEVPLDQIVDYARVQRKRGTSPLVQILFVMQNTPQIHFGIPGLDIQVLPAPITTSKFDIAVFVEERSDGLDVEWVYATHLFQAATMGKMMNAWNELLQQVIATPEASLEEGISCPVERVSDKSSARASASGLRPEKMGKLDKLKNIAKRPTASTSVHRSPVRTSFLTPGRQFPLVVEATSPDIDAVAWAAAQRGFIEESLGKYAGILFRNFSLKTPRNFEAFAEAIEPQLYGNYGDLPKKEGGRNIYQSTPYPERQMILYHNESSHLERWPRKQWFFCEVPSRVGGATPIVDCREMMRRLPPDVVRLFEDKGLLYVRTFTPRLDVSWQDFYKTDDRAEVEAQLAAAGITWRWLDKDTLQTRSHSPAVITHPLTGERVFFNQVQLHHPYCLEGSMRADLLNLVGAERMPRQVYYGDGSPIDDRTIALIGRCYEQCAVRFVWRQGDVALLDNMLVAHARDPFQGERKIVVAMGAMFERAALNSAPEQSSIQHALID